MTLRPICIAVAMLVSSHTFAQKDKLQLYFVDQDYSHTCASISTNNDTLSVIQYFTKCLYQFHRQGFLEASLDSINFSLEKPLAYAHKGNSYMWADLRADSVSQMWFKLANVRINKVLSKPVDPQTISSISQKILQYFENSGYPFAKIQITDSEINGSILSAAVTVNPGPLIIFDTLYIKGDAKISPKFIESYLGFNKGDIYNQKSLNRYNNRLKQLGFVSVIRPSEVEFIPNKVRVYAYLTNRRSNQFSGLIGFSSNNQETKKIKFTGDVNLKLHNSFGQGERNIFRWQAQGEGSQRMDISTSWPYLAGSKMGMSSSFNLYRRDTTYLSINPKVFVDFYLPNGSSIGLGLNYKSSSTTAVSSALGNYSQSLYQINYTSADQSDEAFSTSPFSMSSTLGIGVRNAKKDVIDNQNTKSTLGEISIRALGFYPVFHQSFVVHFKIQGQALAHINNRVVGQQFLDNELYLIGGIDNLRGFNQESIATDLYGISTVEAQVRLQNTINFYVFIDKAFVSYKTFNTYQEHWPLSTGFGFQLLNKGGLFNISYALAKGLGEDLRLNNAKIHVGYSAFF